MESEKKMEVIQSTNNPRIKTWYQLKSKKGRQEQGLYIIEGIKLIEEAIDAKQEIEALIFDQGKDLPESLALHLEKYDLSIPIVSVSTPVIEKLSDTETPQGVLAILKKKNIEIEKLLENQFSFYLLIDQIQDPGNLGTIIRSADAAGVQGIILGNSTVELYNSKVIRSAMGSIFHLSIVQDELDQIIPKLQKNGVKVIGTSPYASKTYFEVDLTQKVAIIVGNEAKGLSDSRKQQVDEMIKIPLVGKAESLNVAMATTLILYERVRQMEKGWA
ncbi:hypothetical protein U473_01855 [Tepidibacillus decaturensis]|uniref:RNA 2-O ribose methyltransferase substrate binding domain-containing protein n=2 Tax=Bacillaceae TaxID=186817 RepID=A0A135L1N0_9BACI|nr:hypothetical protein U473_01855 [Tepidibacillus decaturensis]